MMKINSNLGPLNFLPDSKLSMILDAAITIPVHMAYVTDAGNDFMAHVRKMIFAIPKMIYRIIGATNVIPLSVNNIPNLKPLNRSFLNNLMLYSHPIWDVDARRR